MVLDELDPRFFAATSTIPGQARGCLHAWPFGRATGWPWWGCWCARDSEADRCTAFADEYKLRAGEFLLIPCGMAALANHSARAQSGRRWSKANRSSFNCRRDVEAGEELFFCLQRLRSRSLWHRLSPAPGLPQPAIVDTDPSSSFVCEYVAGVNRVLSLPPYLLVDNIGRNVEVWQFEPGAPEPCHRARYDLTSYPGDPIASLLDVDIHAAFLRRMGGELLTINHFGRVRRFELPPHGVHIHATGELQLLGDIERVVLAGDCFIGSSPRGEHTDDAPPPGPLPVRTHPGVVRACARPGATTGLRTGAVGLGRGERADRVGARDGWPWRPGPAWPSST